MKYFNLILNKSSKQKVEIGFKVVYQEIYAPYNRINDFIDQIFASQQLSDALRPSQKIPQIINSKNAYYSLDFSNELAYKVKPLFKLLSQIKVKRNNNNYRIQFKVHLDKISSQQHVNIYSQILLNKMNWVMQQLFIRINQLLQKSVERQSNIQNQTREIKIQLLNENLDDVFILNFMKKSKNYVSGSSDKSIVIQQLNQINERT